MKELTIKELYGLKAAVHALSFYDVKGIDVKHLDNILHEAIRDTYMDQLQEQGDKGNGFTKEMKSICDDFEKETNLHKVHVKELQWERDYDYEMMMSELDDED